MDRKCSNCGAWGVGVVTLNGMCAHCTRTRAHSSSQAASDAGRSDSNARAAVAANTPTGSASSAGAAKAGQKRARDDGVDTENDAHTHKHTHMHTHAHTSAAADVGLDHVSEEDLARMLAEAEKAEVPTLDATGVKRMLLAVEKKITKNQLLRAKHGDTPARFMESELELDEELKALRILATDAGLYHVLYKGDSLKSLMSLLTHENSDIAIDVVMLLEDMTDEDAIGENEEEAKALVQAIVDAGGLELLMSNLQRLHASDGADDQAGVYHTLSLFNNFVDIDGHFADVLCDNKLTKTSLLGLLFDRLRSKTYDDNKGASAELLSVLLTASPALANAVGKGTFSMVTSSGTRSVDGVEMMLSILNQYKKRAPGSKDEEEAVSNVFDALCTCLMLSPNQDKFRAAEGFELMLQMIRETGYVRFGAIKVISYAVTNNARSCEALVDAGGLKEVFPAFMGKGLAHTRKVHGADAAKSEEEYAASIVSSLLQLLPAPRQTIGTTAGSGGGIHLLRTLMKFKENDHEKIDRTVEMYQTYLRRVHEMDTEEEEDEDLDEATLRELRYLRRLDHGLATLQRLALILSRLVVEDANEDIRRRFDVSFITRSKLYEQGGSLLPIIEILVEYADHLVTDAEAAEASAAAGAAASGSASTDQVSDAASILSLRSYVQQLVAQVQQHAGLLDEEAVAAVQAVSQSGSRAATGAAAARAGAAAAVTSSSQLASVDHD